MNHYITFHRLARAVRENAAERGYHGDVYADVVPDCGTPREEWVIATIRVDVAKAACGLTPRQKAIVGRLARAAVLCPAWRDGQRPFTPAPASPARRPPKW